LEWRKQIKKILRQISQTLDRNAHMIIQSDTEKRELLKNPTKIEEIQEKKIIDRNYVL